MLEGIITSAAKRKLLALFFMNPKRKFYLREVQKNIGENVNTASRELARLQKAGILTSERKANLLFYAVNEKCPIYDELKRIIIKTEGIGEALREEFAGFGDILFAFIYGSSARGDEREKSDIDLMVIAQWGGDEQVEFGKLVRKMEHKVGREINYSVYPPEEFLSKKEKGFIVEVLKGKKIMLRGTEDELERFAAGQ